MDDKTTERAKRERIGLTLAPDVMTILDRFGRFRLGDDNAARPTRTEIIEEAVREWRQNRLPKTDDLLGSDPGPTKKNPTNEVDRQTRTRPSDFTAPAGMGTLHREHVKPLLKPGKK